MDAEALHTRREARRRAVRRRRRLTGAGLIAAVLVALAVVLATSSGGSSKPAAQRTQSANSIHSTQPGRAASGATTVTATATGPPGTGSVPILMYHVIAAPPAGAPFPGLYVTPGEFAAQMQALHSAGWHAVTLDQVEAHWREGTPLGPGRPIVISFDNGYQSQYTQALPVLRRLGWVGDENIQLTGLPPSQGGLSQSQVRGLLAAGWELDTQGISHADLITLDSSSCATRWPAPGRC